MAITNIEPPPTGTPVIEKNGMIQKNWLDWLLLALIERVQGMSFVRGLVALIDQAAAIGNTPVLIEGGAGLYEVSWYLQVSTVDGVSSSVQVTITATNLGQTITKVGANVNGDTLTSKDSGTFFVRVDSGSSLYYSTSYASNTPGQMRYSLDVIVKAVQ